MTLPRQIAEKPPMPRLALSGSQTTLESVSSSSQHLLEILSRVLMGEHLGGGGVPHAGLAADIALIVALRLIELSDGPRIATWARRPWPRRPRRGRAASMAPRPVQQVAGEAPGRRFAPLVEGETVASLHGALRLRAWFARSASWFRAQVSNSTCLTTRKKDLGHGAAHGMHSLATAKA